MKLLNMVQDMSLAVTAAKIKDLATLISVFKQSDSDHLYPKSIWIALFDKVHGINYRTLSNS